MNFENIPWEIERVWHQYAQAKANSEMLSESKHSILAMEASKHEGSEAERNRIARCSDAYKKYLKWVQEARSKELTLKATMDSLDKQFEYCRSMNSLKKKEINNL